MKKFCLMIASLAFMINIQAQTRTKRISNAAEQFMADSQLQHAMVSYLVLDAESGKEVYSINKKIGLAAASTQKIFTAIAACDMLGMGFRYNTGFYIQPAASGATLIIQPSGDPTLGSDRWAGTSAQSVSNKLTAALKVAGVPATSVNRLLLLDPGYASSLVPEGWIWQDIGNYYGAGFQSFNWRENQFNALFRTGTAIGDSISVSGIEPTYLKDLHFDVTALKTAAKGSGDNGYIYYDVWKPKSYRVSGTLPAGEKAFSLSAAHPDPAGYFAASLTGLGLQVLVTQTGLPLPSDARKLFVQTSPALDSILYWFLQKSINLYGEALLHTIPFKKDPDYDVTRGLQQFWNERGIDSGSLHLLDGSGLSPQNRVTTEALVKALQYASRQTWFSDFYKALPLINGQHMKSGSIEGARAYAGYQKASDGSAYIFAVIVNNYQGSAKAVAQKLFRMLNALK